MDLDVDFVFGIGYWVQVVDVVVIIDLDGWVFGQVVGLGFVELVVEMQGVVVYVGVGRVGYFEVLGGFQDVLVCGGMRCFCDQFFWYGDLYYLYLFFFWVDEV